MPTPTPDESRSKAARVAGLCLLSAIVIVILANYGVSFRLIVPGNAVDTARNILAHETLFRLNIAGNLVYLLANVILLSALYVVLKPAGRATALAAAVSRFVFALMWGSTALSTLSALRLLHGAPYLQGFEVERLQALARLQLASSYDAYYVGLPFWGLASTLCCVLWLKSRSIPRPLAAYGLLASTWCLFCAFTFLVFPHFESIVGATWFDLPQLVFELALGFWLLFKGLNLAGSTGADPAAPKERPSA